MTEPSPEECLQPASMVDSNHAAVAAFAQEHAQGATDRERAVALYYAVRDGFRYDPYRVDLSPQGMSASSVLANGHGWCVPKAALLAAACRSVGIPARLGFADVRNHLSTERMRRVMQTDVFTWHGYTDIWLGGAWRKATPAFNLALCQKFGLLPLEFDGVDDSIYHPFDQSGQRHMEYVRMRGTFLDIPLQQITDDFRRDYPGWMAEADAVSRLAKDDFMADVASEPPGTGR
ncbi:MAG: transglutaminase family protein [Burkholderiales bacterium]|nr:transglutaminase family protein [Burkholderiales bacterium]